MAFFLYGANLLDNCIIFAGKLDDNGLGFSPNRHCFGLTLPASATEAPGLLAFSNHSIIAAL